MAAGFLYERITQGRPATMGTLAEPDGAPEPRFALQGTVNWMHALALLAKDEGVDRARMQVFYRQVQRSSGLTDAATNTVFEQLLMSLHHLSALCRQCDDRGQGWFAATRPHQHRNPMGQADRIGGLGGFSICLPTD